MSKKPLSYRDAGVDIERATAAKDRIVALARATHGPQVLGKPGGFGGLFDLAGLGLEQPVLVASADGVGTKLKVAFESERHTSVGADLVNHCVNDILVQGARPLFFLDYFASAGLPPDTVASVIDGVARACREHDCALLGGETAEMPGFYAAGEYDLAGTVVGVVERSKILPRDDIKPGDLLLALPSLGLHTNGYSLARKVLFEVAGLGINDTAPELEMTVADLLLTAHASYFKTLWPAMEAGLVKGLSHITGGGIPENVPRVLPEGCQARLEQGSWPIPPIFEVLRTRGDIPPDEMLKTFNLGVGMIAIVETANEAAFIDSISKADSRCYRVGEVIEGPPQVLIE